MSAATLERPAAGLDIYMIAMGGTGMAPLACLLRGDRPPGARRRPAALPADEDPAGRSRASRPLVGYDAAHLDPAAGARPARPGDRRQRGAAPQPGGGDRRTAWACRGCRCPKPCGAFSWPTGGRWWWPAPTAKPPPPHSPPGCCCAAGATPASLIGGVPKTSSAASGSAAAPRFVVEGDEYNAAYFDRGPKFLHYRPQTLILNSVEYDHADLYPSHQILLDAYRQLVALVPPDGLADRRRRQRPPARGGGGGAACEVVFFGFDEKTAVRPLQLELGAVSSSFRIADPEAGEVALELLRDPPAATTCSTRSRSTWRPAATASRRPRSPPPSPSSPGCARRLDELGTAGGVTVIDDFAHHPTVVAMSLGGLRQKYPGRRLAALFEPRSLTAGRSVSSPPTSRRSARPTWCSSRRFSTANGWGPKTASTSKACAAASPPPASRVLPRPATTPCSPAAWPSCGRATWWSPMLRVPSAAHAAPEVLAALARGGRVLK